MKKKYDYDVHRYTIAKLLETKDKKETPYFQRAIWLPEIKNYVSQPPLQPGVGM